MTLQSGWFKGRLTSSKQDSAMQKGLADIVQSLVESVVEPLLTRITNRKSFFTMYDVDLDTRIEEMGQFFTIRSSDASSKPMLLQQRLDEIHFKGTSRPITQTFYREFNGIPITWQPLYAPIDTTTYPYGTVLIAENNVDSVGDNFGDLFLTSRGVISIPLVELTALIAAETGDSIKTSSQMTEEALTKFKQVVLPLLPLHIVFDGMQLLAVFSIDERSDFGTLISVDSLATYQGKEKADIGTIVSLTYVQAPVTATPAPSYVRGLMRHDDIINDGAVLDQFTYPDFNDVVDYYFTANDASDKSSFSGAEADVSFGTIANEPADSTSAELVQYGFTGSATPASDTGSDFLTRFDNTPHDTSVDYEDTTTP
jgi:hypothetical protein